MKISKNWTDAERKEVALDLAVKARRAILRTTMNSVDLNVVWDMVDTISWLLEWESSSLERLRAEVLKYYKE